MADQAGAAHAAVRADRRLPGRPVRPCCTRWCPQRHRLAGDVTRRRRGAVGARAGVAHASPRSRWCRPGRVVLVSIESGAAPRAHERTRCAPDGDLVGCGPSGWSPTRKRRRRPSDRPCPCRSYMRSACCRSRCRSGRRSGGDHGSDAAGFAGDVAGHTRLSTPCRCRCCKPWRCRTECRWPTGSGSSLHDIAHFHAHEHPHVAGVAGGDAHATRRARRRVGVERRRRRPPTPVGDPRRCTPLLPATAAGAAATRTSRATRHCRRLRRSAVLPVESQAAAAAPRTHCR